MIQQYPKRLIEVDLPIARISAHARREKSIRHGHISTLHIWWARRPLAACRAVICAALWPDPADLLCPLAFRAAAVKAVCAFAKRVYSERVNEESKQLQETASVESLGRWGAIAAGTLTLDPAAESDWGILRLCLLDFIADFANWDNSTVPAYLEMARALTQAGHEALGGQPGTRPMIVDPFAGGGSIPLEALRVGADAFASDLNPVAVLLNKVLLEYIPKYGNIDITMKDAQGTKRTFNGLAEAVRYWGNWIKEQAEKELAEFYPQDSDDSTPIAYLWARTILSEAPGQGDYPVEVPLIRNMWLCKKANRKVAMRWVRDKSGSVKSETVELKYADGITRTVRRPLLEIYEPKRASDVEIGTVARGSATCPVTGYTTPVKSVREQLKSRHGGAADARLFATISLNAVDDRRTYRIPTRTDVTAAARAKEHVEDLSRSVPSDASGLSLFPNEPLDIRGVRHTWAMIYGIDRWEDAFSPRQRLALATLVAKVRLIPNNSPHSLVIRAVLALGVGRQADYLSSLTVWSSSGEFIAHTFGRQALPLVWEWPECCLFGPASGNWCGAIDWIARVIENCASSQLETGHAAIANAAAHPFPDDSVNALITDPPYYDAVPYSYLSDFFYVWLRRALQVDLPDVFQLDAAPKDDEIIVDRPHELSDTHKTIEFYERRLTDAFDNSRRILAPAGIGVVVFASKTTSSWEAILQAIVDAGWTITASWPVDTERESRVSAQGQARLASSIHLVCRPRENADGSPFDIVGEWRDILGELPRQIHAWMPRLTTEGVVGADAIFACLGPALEIFSRYSRVEKASGETATLREYLEHVWAAVSTEALSLIFKEADASGLEPDARLTAMWLWTIGGSFNGNGKKAVDSPPSAASQTEGDEEQGTDDDEEGLSSGGSSKKVSGFTLEYDAARKIAQGLGVHLEQSESIVEVRGDKARLLPVAERTQHLFGQNSHAATSGRGKKRKQKTFFDELNDAEAAEEGWGELKGPAPGSTVLDRLHQAMILFAAGRGELMKRFLVDDGVGKDARFWKLADNLNKLYPPGTDERRWVEGVLARKKGLGL